MARLPGILGGTLVPKWPDFGIEKLPGHTEEQYMPPSGSPQSPASQTIWRASTDTGRPDTPVFSIWLTSSAHLSEDEARFILGERLLAAYTKAHPLGCGSR